MLVDRGLGGRSPFRAGHGVVGGYDQVGKHPILGDPLVPGWQRCTFDDLFDAAAALVLSRRTGRTVGSGFLYGAFSRDVYDETIVPRPPKRRRVRFEPGAIWVYSVNARLQIAGRVARTFARPTSAPCAAPRRYAWPGTGSRRLVKVTAGPLAGLFVQPGATHVTLEVSQ